MGYLLLIDAATSSCRVGVGSNEKLCSEASEEAGFKHAEQLTLLIERCMADAQVPFSDLVGVAITGGPGSYTGLRIGASVAKGIAYAWQLPLIALNTLEVMAKGFQLAHPELDQQSLMVPMIDARRMEVFTAAFDVNGHGVMLPQPLILTESSFSQLGARHFHFFGDGAPKFKDLFPGEADFTEHFYLGMEPMRQLAFRNLEMGKLEDIAYYRPDYHKDFYSPTSN
ncbi:MAG: tRNA (adenosine(37)-N6)-threonylcarbamoyltransferase complex dimerization subunit type 1 TsaB [Sphingobacteriaceae bacterium]|nr:tRNA (adenosine(37)-N6)-threonylcarbamoyltransferase complex dimerization subunit type 1 TsaB [Sphingobacteriaceae bacterium]